MQIPLIIKGLFFIVTGALLLLNTLGILEASLDVVIIIGSVLMIVYGVVLIDAHKKIMSLFKMVKKEAESE